MMKQITRSMTRRSVLRSAASAATFAGVSLALPGAHAQSIYGKRQVTAFALTGDRYHNIDYVRTALGKTLVKEQGISIDFSDELSLLSAANLKPYKLLIMLRDGMVWPAGYEAALVAAQHGSDVTVVERDGMGGACVLDDCVPSKTLISSDGGVTCSSFSSFRIAPMSCRIALAIALSFSP